MRYSKKTMIIGTVAASVGLAAIAGPVLAANIVSHDDRQAQEQQAFEKSLAEKLGVPQAKVDQALKEIQSDRLDKRIDALQQAGVLTADQATSIKAQIADNKLPEAMNALMAAMTTKRLDALVAAKTITSDQSTQISTLVAAGVPLRVGGPPAGVPQGQTPPDADRHAAHTAEELAALVKDRKITQAQADQVTTLIKAGAPIELGGPGRHGGDGPGMGHHPRGIEGGGAFGGPPPADGGHDGPPSGDGNQPQSFDGPAVGNSPA